MGYLINDDKSEAKRQHRLGKMFVMEKGTGPTSYPRTRKRDWAMQGSSSFPKTADDWSVRSFGTAGWPKLLQLVIIVNHASSDLKTNHTNRARVERKGRHTKVR